jgi:prepilin-type processing-associated H-X9-DG protein
MLKGKKTTIFRPASIPQTRLKLLASFILAAGMASSFLIYQKAQSLYPENDLAESGKYLYNLERHGGEVNVVFADLTHWFRELWQGKPLAFTVAYLSVLVSAGLFFIANQYLWPQDRR